MKTVCFVAPFLLDATQKYIEAAIAVPGARVFVLTQDRADRLPKGAHHWHLPDATRAEPIALAVRDVARQTGGVHALIGILENIQEEIAGAREILGLPGPDRATASRFRDKGLMKEALAKAGLPVARFARLSSAAEALTFVREVGFPVVLKPPDGAGCKATYQCNDEGSLRRALEEARPSASRPVLAESFLSGDEHSFDTVIVDDVPLFHNVLHYQPGPLDVTRNDWIQWRAVAPRDLSGPEYGTVRKVGLAAIRALGLRTGMTHMEWFGSPGGACTIGEIGARPPGAQFTSVMSYVYDRSIYAAWAHAVIDGAVPGTFERKYAAGIAFLRGPGSGRVKRVAHVEAAQATVGKLVVEARLPRVGTPKSTSYEGDGYAIVRHEDTAVVERALRHIIETIQVEYA